MPLRPEEPRPALSIGKDDKSAPPQLLRADDKAQPAPSRTDEKVCALSEVRVRAPSETSSSAVSGFSFNRSDAGRLQDVRAGPGAEAAAAAPGAFSVSELRQRTQELLARSRRLRT